MFDILQLVRMFSFALMFAAFGFVFILYFKNPRIWLKSFLFFLGGTSIFDLVMTFVIFQVVGGKTFHPVFSIFVVIFQIVFVAFMYYFTCRFLFELVEGTSQAKNIKLPILFTLGSWCCLVLIVLFPYPQISQVSQLFIQVSLLGVFLWTYTKRKQFKGGWLNSMVRKFIFLSIIGYVFQCIIFIATILFSQLMAYSLVLQLSISSVFGIIWGILLFVEGAVIFRRKTEESEVLPDLFLGEYKITPREQEIVLFMKKGLSSKDIGETLFISSRTVETHMHKVYKKCGVNGRIELLHLLESFSG